MRDFLSEFVRSSKAACTVVVVDEGRIEQPRRYHLRPFRVLVGAFGVLLGAALLAAAAVAFTPLRTLIPGYGTAQMEQNARQNARQVAALEDSLNRQRHYLRHLQSLMTGPVDSSFVAEVQQQVQQQAQQAAARGASLSPGRLSPGRLSPGRLPADSTWLRGPPAALLRGEDGDEDAAEQRLAGRARRAGGANAAPLVAARLPESVSAKGAQGRSAPVGGDPMRTSNLDPPAFPVGPPAEGFVTRGFDAKNGHYAIDIAAEVGTPVHSIGDGYVVMAGRTERGGQAIAVQHAGGYLSFYKHNSTLRKEVGERVEAREVIAESGNSGGITTGPHLHVELWYNGLAQDPSAYFIE